jgi:RNA polymerase sigma-70 factor (ECF subfamily)
MCEQDAICSSDGSLLRRLVEGDQAAAAEVFQRHATELLTAARKRISIVLNSRVDADDIVQSTFKSFFRRANRGGYAAPRAGDLFNLLIVIAMRKINTKADYHQADCRDVRRTHADELGQLANPKIGHDQALHELCLTIEEIMANYTAVQKLIVTLRLEGHSIQEIANRCDRSKRTVERELQAFRLRICEELTP